MEENISKHGKIKPKLSAWLDTRAEQLIKILSKSQYGLLQFSNRRRQYLLKGKCVSQYHFFQIKYHHAAEKSWLSTNLRKHLYN